MSKHAVIASLLISGCTGWNVDPSYSICHETGDTKGAVVTSVTFARLLDDTTAEGLDLDGHASIEGDVEGCFKGDFVGPGGMPGVDNQLATLLPLVEDIAGSENIDALLEGAIANGQLLIMLALVGVDDPLNDDCVNLRIGAGLGTPFLDTNGTYVPYQTFAFDDDPPSSELLNGQIVDGVFTAGPGHVLLPVTILDVHIDLDLEFAKVRLAIDHDPIGGGFALSGLVGGGIHVDAFDEIIEGINVSGDLVGAILPLIAGVADLGMEDDGVCKRLSAALKFQTTPAFLYEG
jgi:hypothetical protein